MKGGVRPPGAADLVELDRNHPGFRDLAYRARRNAIARAALDPTDFQPRIFVAPSWEHLLDGLAGWVGERFDVRTD